VRKSTGPLAVLAHAPADLEPVEVGQHHVEQDEVGFEGADGRRGPGARCGRGDVETEVTKGRAEQERDVLLVVDDENPVDRSVAVVMASGLMDQPRLPVCESSVSRI